MQFAGNTDADSLAIFCTTSPACMCDAPMMVLIRDSVNKMEFSCAAVIIGFGRGVEVGTIRITTVTAAATAAKAPPAMIQRLRDFRGRAAMVSCGANGCIGIG